MPPLSFLSLSSAFPCGRFRKGPTMDQRSVLELSMETLTGMQACGTSGFGANTAGSRDISNSRAVTELDMQFMRKTIWRRGKYKLVIEGKGVQEIEMACVRRMFSNAMCNGRPLKLLSGERENIVSMIPRLKAAKMLSIFGHRAPINRFKITS